MAQVTEVVLKEATPEPAPAMEVERLWAANRNTVQLCRVWSEHLMWLIKSRSNNAPTLVEQEDVKECEETKSYYIALKAKIKSASKAKTSGDVETELAIAVPTANEMKKIYNTSLEYYAHQVYNLIEVLANMEEAGFKLEIKDKTLEDLISAEDAVDGALELIKSGARPSRKAALGTLVPSSDFDWERKIVPSSEKPKLQRMDVPDKRSGDS